MISGYFDLYGTPYLEAHLSIERLEVDGYVQFLVDTGADSGALHPADGELLGCRFDLLIEHYPVSGVGESPEYYPEEAIITFEGNEGSYEFVVILDIAKPDQSIRELPSLIGRDILNEIRMNYDYGEEALHIHPLD